LAAIQVGGNETRHHVERVVFAIVHLKQGMTIGSIFTVCS
jgi:hypothetical protein